MKRIAVFMETKLNALGGQKANLKTKNLPLN